MYQHAGLAEVLGTYISVITVDTSSLGLEDISERQDHTWNKNNDLVFISTHFLALVLLRAVGGGWEGMSDEGLKLMTFDSHGPAPLHGD